MTPCAVFVSLEAVLEEISARDLFHSNPFLGHVQFPEPEFSGLHGELLPRTPA